MSAYKKSGSTLSSYQRRIKAELDAWLKYLQRSPLKHDDTQLNVIQRHIARCRFILNSTSI